MTGKIFSLRRFRIWPRGFVLVAFLAALPLVAQQTTYRQQDDQLIREVCGTIATPSPLQIKVVSQLGNVRLEPATGNTLRYDVTFSTKNSAGARAALDQLPLQVRRQGEALLISANGASSRSLTIAIEVPANATAVRVDSAIGNISAGDLAVPLHLETAAGNLATQGGNIEVDEVRGGLRATTAGGTIRIRRCTGDVFAMTGGGNIELGSIDGIVHARTGGGNIEIEHARSASGETGGGNIHIAAVAGPVTARTGAGGVQVGIVVANGSFGDSVIQSGIGRVTVLLPPQLATRVTAELAAPMGHAITSDFPALNAKSHDSPPLHVEAALNGGGPSLHIASNGGDIMIRKQSAAALRSAVDWSLGTAKLYGN